MSSFALYLLKAILCSGVLYGYYYLALRNRLFHQYNRFYLLAAVLFSLVFPIIPLPTVYQYATTPQEITLYKLLVSTGGEDVVLSAGTLTWNWPQIALAVYCMIAVCLLIRLLVGLWQIRKLLHHSAVEQLGSVAFVSTNHSQAPFSFFRWLFWKNEIDLNSAGGQSIFRHELVHIREHHTVDKLLLQITLVGFWINPFFWIIRRELQMIHEFIADKKAVGHQGAEALAAMILQSVYGKQIHPLVNPFFKQPIKRRLAMLQKTLKQPRNAYLGRILTLPLCAVLLFAFSKSKMDTPENASVYLDETITVIIDAGHGGEDAGVSSDGISEKNITLALAKKIREINTNEKIRIVLTRTADERPELKQRVDLATKEGANLFISLHAMADPLGKESHGNSDGAKGIEVHVSGKNEASRNRSILLGSALIQQLSTIYNTKPNLLTRPTGVWVLDANTVPAVLIECGYISNAQDLAFISKKENQELIAKKILAAIEMYATAKEPAAGQPLDTLPQKANSENIKEVRVNKKDSIKAITITYKNGTTETLTQKQAMERGLITPPPPPPPPAQAPPPPPPPANENALVVIDGKEIGTMAEINKSGKELKPDEIELINVLKGENATRKYGAKGSKGVIEITTKKKAGDKVSMKGPNTEALVVIDDEIKGTMKDFKDDQLPVRPEQIKSVHVLKDKHATEKYGDKGKNGVIEIYTKS